LVAATAHSPVAQAAPASQVARAASDARAKAQAISALRAAAKRLHIAADQLVDVPGDLLENLKWQFALGEMKGAIRDARRLGLSSVAQRYEALLKRETSRVDFAHLVHRAEKYGDDVAQQAHDDDPQLDAGQLGEIASNASAWYGNSTVQKNLLASAKKIPRQHLRGGGRIGPGPGRRSLQDL
jgi:hypothetical protein